MCVGENTARPANVRAVRRWWTARALQSGRKFLCQKVILFDSLTPPAGAACGRGFPYPDLLAEERDDTVEEITDGGDDVLDLAGKGGDLLLRAGKLLERVLHGLHL